MRQIIIIMIFGLHSFLIAQVKIPMRTSKIEDVNHIIKELIKDQYHLSQSDTSKMFKPMSYYFVNQDSSNSIRIKFFKGKEEKTYYEFSQVEGKYSDLFPFWKKYIDQNATDVQEQKVVVWKVGDRQKRLVFYKANNDWVITVRS